MKSFIVSCLLFSGACIPPTMIVEEVRHQNKRAPLLSEYPHGHGRERDDCLRGDDVIENYDKICFFYGDEPLIYCCLKK